MLGCSDNKIIQVSLDALDNILRVGEQVKEETSGMNQMAMYVEVGEGNADPT